MSCRALSPRPRQRQRQYVYSTWLTTPKNTWPRYSRTGEAAGATSHRHQLTKPLCLMPTVAQMAAPASQAFPEPQSMGTSAAFLSCWKGNGDTSCLSRDSSVILYLSFFPPYWR